MSTTLARRPRTKSTAAHWTAICRSHKRPGFLKRADLGGSADSIPFEQAFSSLAHAYLQDKAPGLKEYELGFQLIEKNEDNDKAVGVFGFSVGPQLLYAPVFFIAGELKGHELLYLKDSDTFVPLKENWINYILNRKPNILGEETTRNVRQLGVERPSMDWFRDSPSKYSSYSEAWLREGMPGIANALVHPVPAGYELAVPKLIKESSAMAMRLVQLLDGRPALAAPIAALYGPDLIKTAIDVAKTAGTIMPTRPATGPRRRILTGSVWAEKSAAAVAREEDPINTGKLKIHTYNGECPAGLSEKQAEKLKRDGIYVDDEREDTSKIFRVQKPLTLQNPDESGIYDVVVRPNDFEKCLILLGPYGRRGRQPGAVLVRMGDGNSKAWCHKHPGDLFTTTKYENDDYQKFFDGLPDASSGLTKGGTYILIAPNGQGTQVFEVERSGSASGDEKRYDIYWRGGYSSHRPDHLPPIYEERYEYARSAGSVNSICIGAKGGSKPLARQEVLYFPPGTKALKLREPKSETDDKSVPCCVGADDTSDPPPLEPGNHIDLQLGIYKMSNELKVFNDGCEVTLNNMRMPGTAAMVSLIRDYGLREKTARAVLKEAQLNRGQCFRIKYAQPYELLQSAPPAPSMPDPGMSTDTFMGSDVPMQEYDEREIPVDGMYMAEPGQYNAARPPDPQTMTQLQDAAATGQKEVLDTSLLANLLKGTRDDTLIDKYLGDLVKGLDRIGRLLFNYYWHHDEFEERYGGSDLPELEDALRNSFENLGDLTLLLKQKTIEPFPGEGTEVDLGPAAGVS